LKQGIKADLYLDAGKLKKVKPSIVFDVEKKSNNKKRTCQSERNNKNSEIIAKSLFFKYMLLIIMIQSIYF
jgi:hypothetical protein